MGMRLRSHGLYTSTGMESGQLVDHPIGGVCPGVDLPAIGRDGEEVSGSVEGARSHPPAVPAERDVLHASRGGSAEQSVEMVHGRLPGEPGVGHQVEHVEGVALGTGRHQQRPAGGETANVIMIR